MGFLDIFKTPEPEQEELRASGITNIMSVINGATQMDINVVEKIPAVQACSNIITNTVASLPLYLYRENELGHIERVYGDYREFLVNSEPNSTINAFNLKKQIVKDYLFYGAGYIKVDWENNKVNELWNLDADKVQLLKYQNGYKASSRIKYLNGCDLEFDADEVAMILRDSSDGIKARGLLHTGVETFSIALHEMRYTDRVYSKGALPLGILKSSNRLSADVLERLRNSWSKLYAQGSNTAASTVILEEGLDFQAISLDPDKLKLIDSKNHTASEICRLFNVPESIINSAANKYGSLEQNNLQFLQYCLSPILNSIETAFNKSILLESEKKENYFFAFDTSEIQKGTEKERYEALKVGLEAGIVSVNEARSKVNLKPIEDDILKWSLGSVLYYMDEKDPDKRLFIPNLAYTKGQEGNVKENSKEEAKEEIKEGVNKDGKLDNSDSKSVNTSKEASK